MIEAGAMACVDIYGDNKLKKKCIDMPATTMPVKPQNYADLTGLEVAICSLDSGKFCRSGSKFVIQDVCMNYDKLPVAVQTGTSIEFACKADWGKICGDIDLKTYACPTGTASTNLCALEPEKCVAGSDKFDACFENFEHCLVKPDWKLCDKVPKLCDLAWKTSGANFDATMTGNGSTKTTVTDPITGTITETEIMADGTTMTRTKDKIGTVTEIKHEMSTKKTTTTVSDASGRVMSINENLEDGTIIFTFMDPNSDKKTTTITRPDGKIETTESLTNAPGTQVSPIMDGCSELGGKWDSKCDDCLDNAGLKIDRCAAKGG
jgi:hypothetical protein